MDWKSESIWELRNLEAKRASIPDLQAQIRALNSQMTAIRSATSDGTPVPGGGGREDMLLNCITERDLLVETLAITRTQVDMIDRALAFLSEEDREMLTRLFISPKRDSLYDLCDKFGYSESTVRRRKNKALSAYTVRRRGLTSI